MPRESRRLGAAEVPAFLGVTFGLTWGLAAALLLFPEPFAAFGPMGPTNPLFVLAVYAPAIAAIALILMRAGGSGLAAFLARLGLWRCHPGWYAAIVLGIPLLAIAAAFLNGNPSPLAPPATSWTELAGLIGIMVVLGPVEELGWRGFLLPALQQRYTPIRAGLIVGVVWGIWHIPAFLIADTPQSGWAFAPYFVAVVSVSVIMTALFNASGGSLLLAMLMHFQLNNPLLPDGQPFDAAVYALAALAVVFVFRDTALNPQHAASDVMPNRPSAIGR